MSPLLWNILLFVIDLVSLPVSILHFKIRFQIIAFLIYIYDPLTVGVFLFYSHNPLKCVTHFDKPEHNSRHKHDRLL